MKMTGREKLMIIVLGIAALVFLSYRFVISPRLDEITAMNTMLSEKKTEVANVQARLASAAELDAALEELSRLTDEKTSDFYPKILQKQIILLLDRVIKDSGIRSDSTGFTQIEGLHMEEEGKPMVQRMSVVLPFQGSYDQIMKLIRQLESEDRYIIINSLQITEGTDGLSGGMNIDFYALAKQTVDDRDNEYLSWPYSGVYGRYNPFREAASQGGNNSPNDTSPPDGSIDAGETIPESTGDTDTNTDDNINLQQ